MKNLKPGIVQFPLQDDADTPGSNEASQADEPFPVQSLPPILCEMATAISDSIQVPIELSGPTIMVTLSAAIGKNLEVRSGADLFARANLYFLGFAESGTGKSLTFAEAARPITDFQKERLREWAEITYPDLEAESRLLAKEIAALEQSVVKTGKGAVDRQTVIEQLKEKIRALHDTKDRMKEPRIIIEDVTSEAAALRIQQNKEQAFSLSSDAGQVIQNLEGRYSKNKTPDDSIYVKSFSGDSHSVERVTRPPIDLDHPWLAAMWLTQPDKAARLLENSALSVGGLLPRFLMCDTKCEPTESDDDGVPIPVEVRQAYRALINSVLVAYWDNDQPLRIPDSPEAATVIRAYRNHLVRRRRTDLRDVNIFVARWHELTWHIAIVLHIGLLGDQAHLSPISAKTAKDAVTISKWFGEQQLRLLSVLRIFRDEERLERLLRIVDNHYNGQASLRDLERCNNYRPEELRRLAAQFPGCIVIKTLQPGPTGGRPSEVLQMIAKRRRR